MSSSNVKHIKDLHFISYKICVNHHDASVRNLIIIFFIPFHHIPNAGTEIGHQNKDGHIRFNSQSTAPMLVINTMRHKSELNGVRVMCSVGLIHTTYIDSVAAAAISNSALPRLLSSDSSLLAISLFFHEASTRAARWMRPRFYCRKPPNA